MGVEVASMVACGKGFDGCEYFDEMESWVSFCIISAGMCDCDGKWSGHASL